MHAHAGFVERRRTQRDSKLCCFLKGSLSVGGSAGRLLPGAGAGVCTGSGPAPAGLAPPQSLANCFFGGAATGADCEPLPLPPSRAGALAGLAAAAGARVAAAFGRGGAALPPTPLDAFPAAAGPGRFSAASCIFRIRRKSDSFRAWLGGGVAGGRSGKSSRSANTASNMAKPCRALPRSSAWSCAGAVHQLGSPSSLATGSAACGGERASLRTASQSLRRVSLPCALFALSLSSDCDWASHSTRTTTTMRLSSTPSAEGGLPCSISTASARLRPCPLASSLSAPYLSMAAVTAFLSSGSGGGPVGLGAGAGLVAVAFDGAGCLAAGASLTLRA
mmetsp:Transcript_26353/g.61543  ORF Transcript_26353/g.61543 Transcript_26353/m.61543 type:complete len:334 (-) Transcript_26353:1739-2740(-)